MSVRATCTIRNCGQRAAVFDVVRGRRLCLDCYDELNSRPCRSVREVIRGWLGRS